MFILGTNPVPGVSPGVFDYNPTLVFNQYTALVGGVQIASDAVDAGNSPTNVLRAGLVLAQRYSDNNYVPYVPTGLVNAVYVPGADVAKCVLAQSISTTGFLGTPGASVAPVFFGGDLLGQFCIGLDFQARQQLGTRFTWGDDYPSGEKIKTIVANTTAALADYGTTFATDGAAGSVTLTIPSACKVAGWWAELLVLADQTAAVNAGANLLVGDGGLTFTTATFSTAAHKIGGRLRVQYSPKLSAFIGNNRSAGPGNVITWA